MNIFINALNSIQVGVEDFEAEDERRLLSAVRSIMAGILLLYKEKLRRLSPAHDPEALIKWQVIPKKLDDGTMSVVGKGKRTADFQQIKERFEQFAVAVDWKRLERMRALRNDIEHYYTVLSEDSVKEVLANSFLLIRDFLYEELREDPLTALGEVCWSSLLNVAEVYDKEANSCAESLNEIDWKYDSLSSCVEYFRCPQCHSSLILTEDAGEYTPDLGLLCKSCGHAFTIDSIIDDCVDKLLGGEAYVAATDGGEPPYTECPSCNRTSYIFQDAVCISCEYTMEHDDCWRCGCSLSPEEQVLDGLCSYCAHVEQKMLHD